MARKFEYKAGCYGWAMERCEERLLIAIFYEIENRIPPDQTWKTDFLDHFYQHGNGVTFETVSEINANRRRLNLEPVNIRETVVYEHARSADKLRKSELRRQWRDEYHALDTAGKVRWRNTAEDETARLLPPHLTFEQWKARRSAQTSPPMVLTSRERAIRDRAVETAAAAPARPASADALLPDSVSLVIRRLKLARKPETRDFIVSQTPPADALIVAESGKIEDPDLIDSLVIRSLDAA